MLEHIEIKKRFLALHEGKLKEHVNEKEIRIFNSLSHVHLINLTYKTVEKKTDTSTEKVGEVIQFHFLDADNYYIVETWANSIYAKAFYFVMESINFNHPFTLRTDLKIKEGKKKPALFVRQNGHTLKWNYTKENMKDCPPIEVYSDSGRQCYDDTLQQLYFNHKIDSWLLSVLKSIPIPFPDHPVYEHIHSNAEANSEDNQNPPF